MRPEPDYDIAPEDFMKDWPTVGTDSMLMRMNPGFTLLHETEPEQFSKLLVRFSHLSASMVSSVLHRAQWWITTDPALVHDIGITHDCELCLKGTAEALEALETEPDTAILCGLFYWAQF